MKITAFEGTKKVNELLSSNLKDFELLREMRRALSPIGIEMVVFRNEGSYEEFSITAVDECLYRCLEPVGKPMRLFIPPEFYMPFVKQAIDFIRKVTAEQIDDLGRLPGFAAYETDVQAWMDKAAVDPKFRQYFPDYGPTGD